MKKQAFLFYTLLVASSFLSAAALGQNSPKVVVGIVVDQLRTDYVERFNKLYGDGGFRRLWNEGCVYTHGGFDFPQPERASAMATIYTGAEPCYHGIVGNRYLDRKTLKVLSCVDDDKIKGVHTAERTSPAHLLVTTVADELKMATAGKATVASVAPERDVAVLAGGHAADVVMWLNEANAFWASSTCYGDMPSWMSAYNRRNSSPFDFKSMKWTPLYSTALYEDYGDEPQKAFVHTFSEKTVRRYKTSAIINDEVAQIARNYITTGNFGWGDVTDMLSIGFYGGGYDHQNELYGSMELQDIYARLDRNIADIIETVDERVGLDNAVIFLTSTGCTDGYPIAAEMYHLPTDEVRMDRVTMLLNMYLGAMYGTDTYVEAAYRGQVFFNHKLLEEKQLPLTQVLDHCADFLGQMSGVRRAYTSVELTRGLAPEALCKAYHKDYCGDILLEIAPGWTMVDEQWSERQGISRAAVSFPIVFLGSGIPHRVEAMPVTAEVIAPTLASLMHIGVPNGCASRPLW